MSYRYTDEEMTRPIPVQRVEAVPADVRVVEFKPRRTRLPGLIGAGVIGAAIAAAAISSFYDSRPIGARLDAGVEAAASKMQSQSTAMRDAAGDAAEGAAEGAAKVGENVAAALGDAGITAAVKTALAADPSLSALKIEVSTRDGIVHLQGPAPDDKARERAEVLASAPQGVVSVENGLIVTQSSRIN